MKKEQLFQTIRARTHRSHDQIAMALKAKRLRHWKAQLLSLSSGDIELLNSLAKKHGVSKSQIVRVSIKLFSQVPEEKASSAVNEN